MTLDLFIVYYYKTAALFFVSAARSLTCRDDLDSKWRLLFILILVDKQIDFCEFQSINRQSHL